MLSIAKVRIGRLDYYLGQTRAGGQDAGLIEADGIYLGHLASALKLTTHTVSMPTLDALCRGVDPLSGEILNEQHHRVRNVAYDCTFAAPKSVSLLHALGETEVAQQAEEAHQAAVRAALEYLQESAARVLRSDQGTRLPIAVHELAAASFLHRVSRSLDPHLHTHLLVLNLARDHAARYSALDGRGLYAHAGAAGALYRAQLRHELTSRLQLSWSRSDRGFQDLLGVSPRALGTFSTRRQQIAQDLQRSGRQGPAAARYAAHRTRPQRGATPSYEELVARWRARAAGVGMSISRLSRPVARPGLDEQAVLEQSPEVAAWRIAEQLDHSFARADLVAKTASASTHRSAQEVLQAVDDTLADGRTVRRAADAMSYLSSGAQAFPAGWTEPRFRSVASLAREASVAHLLARLVPMSPGNEHEVLHTNGHFVLRTEDPLVALESVHRLARLLDGTPSHVVQLCANSRQAAHLEALTGVPAVRTPLERVRLQDVLVVHSTGMTPTCLLSLEKRLAPTRPVVFVAIPAAGAEARSASLRPPSWQRDGDGRGLMPPEHVGSVRVYACADPRAAVQVVRVLAQHDPQLVVVGTDPIALRRCGIHAYPEAEALTLLDHDASARIVVIGPPRLLSGRARAQVAEEHRTHVLVEPSGAGPIARSEWLARLFTNSRERDDLARQFVPARSRHDSALRMPRDGLQLGR